MPFPVPAEYRAFGRHVVDGDTFDVLIDLGLNKYAYEAIRLRGIDTPEIFRPNSEAEKELGLQAKVFVEDRILNKPLKIVTYKDKETFGRYECDVWFHDGTEWQDLAVKLAEAGFTKENIVSS